jgi:membrane protein required for colicin V production
LIDIVTFLVLVLAAYKGIRNGLVMALFSFAALLLGLLAALKLSAVTASWLEGTVNVSAKWLPLLAFLLVFVLVVVLVNMIGKLFESTAEWAFLGWVNKGAGVVFYALIYLLTWSVLLFYLDKLSLIRPDAMESSVTYPILAPWGPKVLEWIAAVVPIFKDILNEIGVFLEDHS